MQENEEWIRENVLPYLDEEHRELFERLYPNAVAVFGEETVINALKHDCPEALQWEAICRGSLRPFSREDLHLYISYLEACKEAKALEKQLEEYRLRRTRA